MPAPLILRIIGDAASYVKTAEMTIGVNTKIGQSFEKVGVNAKLSADAQIAAAVKAQEALRANAVALSARASSLPGGSREQAAATLLAAEAQAKYARAVGVTTVSTRGLSSASSTAERDIGKSVRGALAGSGAFHSLGRSLAFASAGYLGVAIGADAIAKSIHQAEDLAKAQESLSVAIGHTGGNAKILLPLYTQTAKAAAEFGITQTEALTGLARATVLTGNAAAAQRAYKEALVISKATGKDFGTVLTATSKAQEGSTTSLRRYGVLVATTSTGQEQLTQVMKRFGGQAAANTTESDKLRAAVANFETELGTALLPTFDRLAHRLTDWLTKMEKSGKLQREVNHVVSDAGHVFHALEAGIGAVDRVTGSLANTLKLLLALKVASVLSGWTSGFAGLAAAETLAAGGAAAGGAAGAAGASGVAARILAYTAAGSAGGLLIKLGRFGGLASATFGGIPDQVTKGLIPFSSANSGVPIPSNFGQLPPVLGGPRGTANTGGAAFAAGATRIRQITTFALSQQEQVDAAQAALTRSTTDDVAGAKAVVARIKRLIDHGRLHGPALIQALQAEASAMSTIWGAEDAAAQKRAARAQAARDRIAAQIQNSIDPLRLEVALSRDQALGHSTRKDLLRLREAAQKALKSGKLSLEQQKEAYDQITSINQQLASQSTAQTHQWKQASTRALTAGLHLSAADRDALRARLSQLGPGGTVPGNGTGAYGYAVTHHHHHLYVDGKEITHSVTKHQQKRRRRNSSQRRGPNAGD